MTNRSPIMIDGGEALACWIDAGRTLQDSPVTEETPLGLWLARGRLPQNPQDEALALMMHELPTEFLEDFVRDAPEGLLKNAAADIIALRAGAFGAALI